MSYAIIGFGNIGQALAKAFARSGIEVSVATTRDPESSASAAAERADFSEHFHLLAAYRLMIRLRRRLHRQESHHLEQVVLNHVADGTGLFVETAAALDAELLGHGDLHALDVVAIPKRLEKRVRETEDQNVLDRFLPKVMVNAKDGRLVEDLSLIHI